MHSGELPFFECRRLPIFEWRNGLESNSSAKCGYEVLAHAWRWLCCTLLLTLATSVRLLLRVLALDASYG